MAINKIFFVLRKIPMVSEEEAREAAAELVSLDDVATKTDLVQLKEATKADIAELKDQLTWRMITICLSMAAIIITAVGLIVKL